jgi:hypothetical protein
LREAVGCMGLFGGEWFKVSVQVLQEKICIVMQNRFSRSQL